MGSADTHPNSFWRATAEPADKFSSLNRDHRVEVLIIGCGFTGLSAARDLLARGVDCLALEAEDIGWGASGRNGGFAVTRYKKNYSAMARMFGDETAVSLFRQAIEAVDSIAETVHAFGISCWFQRDGHVTPAHSETALAGLDEDVRWLRERAGDSAARIMSHEETGAALGTSVYRGAYFDPRSACLHPYNYARGLAAALSARGVPIHVASPVESLRRDGDDWLAETPGGVVRARKVVLATNAYSRRLKPDDDLYTRVVPVSSSVVTTRPLDAEDLERTVPSNLPVTDTRRLVNYFRRLPTGQLLFGGRGDITGRRDDPAVYRKLEAQLVATFPHLAGVEIQQRWSGMVAVTLDAFPHIGRLDKHVFFAVGYGGRGVALTSLLGRRLAAMVAGETVDPGPMGDAGFRPIPFHGWRRMGMRLMAKYYEHRDHFER